MCQTAPVEAERADATRVPDHRIVATFKPKRGEHLIVAPVQTTFKAALYLEKRKVGITRVELAHRLFIDEKEARRVLDPRHPTKADRPERALAGLGRHAELRVA
ncbi:MAG: hypothetical protein ACYC9L_14650 [Sulfuricaulis sp.]